MSSYIRIHDHSPIRIMVTVEEILKGWKISAEKAKTNEQPAIIDILLSCLDTDGFIKISPVKRREIISTWYRQAYASVKKDFKLKKINIVTGTLKEPRMVRIHIPLKEIFLLTAKSYVKNITIIDIEGVIRKTVRETAPTMLFVVKVRFGILIEGQTKGHQQYEDRMVLIKAKHEEEAENKACALLSMSEKPYLNSDKRYVWYKFETILDVCPCYTISPRAKVDEGLEIYSERHFRKISPETTWLLEYADDKS